MHLVTGLSYAWSPVEEEQWNPDMHHEYRRLHVGYSPAIGTDKKSLVHHDDLVDNRYLLVFMTQISETILAVL